MTRKEEQKSFATLFATEFDFHDKNEPKMITEAQKEAQSFVQAFIDEGFLPPAARIAALIAIDKVIDAITKRWGGVNPTTGHQVNHVQVNPYWVEVKQEIEKL